MNKGKVLMVVHNRFQVDNHLPLGYAYIGAVLLQHNVNTSVFDMAIYNYSNEQLAEYLKDNEFDLILLSFLSGRYSVTVKPLCDVINQYKKDAWLCLGGHGAAASESYMLNNTGCEIVCTGEGEYATLEILDCKLNGKSLYDVKGIAFKDQTGKIIINEHRKSVNVNDLPMPAWDLFDMEIYSNNLQFAGMKEGDKALSLISGRGCTNRCSFCYRMEKGIRFRKTKDVVNEMKILNERYGINYYFFMDELFGHSKQRIYEFSNALEKNNLNIFYNINLRCDIMDINLAQVLKDSGCLFVNAGIESTSDLVLQAIGKNCTVAQNHKAAQACLDVDLNIGLNLLWGLPGDSIETLWDNVSFIKQYNTFYQCRDLRPVSPYPGSPLLTLAVEKGFIKHEDEFFDIFKNSDLRMFNYCGISDDIFYSELLKANTELVLDHYTHTNNDMETAWKIINGYKDLYEGRTIEFYGSRSDATNEDKCKIIRV